MASLRHCSVRNTVCAAVAVLAVAVAEVGAAEAEQVLASIKPLALIAEEITEGSSLQVSYLLSPTASEHNYALKMSDIKKLHAARLVIWLDAEAEPYLKSTEGSWLKAERSNKSLALLDGYKPAHHEEEDHHTDPHVWLSPVLAQVLARQIADRLGEIYPQDKQLFDSNWTKFSQASKRLDETTGNMLRPYSAAPFFVHHDAYGYFVAHYQLKQIGVLRAQSEAALSVKHLRALQLSLQVQRQTACLFVEPQLSRPQTAVFKEGAVVLGQLDPLGIDASSYQQLIEALGKGFVDCFERARSGSSPEKKKA